MILKRYSFLDQSQFKMVDERTIISDWRSEVEPRSRSKNIEIGDRPELHLDGTKMVQKNQLVSIQ